MTATVSIIVGEAKGVLRGPQRGPALHSQPDPAKSSRKIAAGDAGPDDGRSGQAPRAARPRVPAAPPASGQRRGAHGPAPRTRHGVSRRVRPHAGASQQMPRVWRATPTASWSMVFGHATSSLRTS
ncbi:MAG: hypothetical protein MZU95_13230 [Desulfomicrobium escambiense]|nr:hypothetical protein [Desulfomicrobium escambiense]